MAKQNFVFTSLLTNRVRPHELREVLNRWGLALRISKANQEALRNHINECKKILPAETVAFSNLIDDLDENIEFWDRTPMYNHPRKRKKKEEQITEPVAKTKMFAVKALSMREVQLEYLLWVLHKNHFNLSHTAESLSISVRTVRNMIRANFGAVPLRSVRKPTLDFSSFTVLSPDSLSVPEFPVCVTGDPELGLQPLQL